MVTVAFDLFEPFFQRGCAPFMRVHELDLDDGPVAAVQHGQIHAPATGGVFALDSAPAIYHALQKGHEEEVGKGLKRSRQHAGLSGCGHQRQKTRAGQGAAWGGGAGILTTR